MESNPTETPTSPATLKETASSPVPDSPILEDDTDPTLTILSHPRPSIWTIA